MKIISFNIRGLGGRVKKRELKQLGIYHKPDMVCIQETKLQTIDRHICAQLWPDDEFDWVGKSSVRRARGLLIMWSKVMF